MGTPAFACKPLTALHNSCHEVVAVVTGDDKRRGRSRPTDPTEVCVVAHELGLPVLKPKTLKSAKLYDQLADLESDLFVVVAFRILPERLFMLPKHGSINLHASLLPKYRGAAPINWALINGETETGLTSFFLKKSVDTGNVILQEKISIDETDNYDSLAARMSEIAGPFLLQTLDLIEQPNFEPQVQRDQLATPAPKLTPEGAMIDFGFPAEKVNNFVRGLSSRPGAYTTFRNMKVKLLAGRMVGTTVTENVRPGSVLPDKKRLLIQCAGSAFEITSLVPQGKREMDGRSFINGFRPEPGELFGEVTQGARDTL
jgi:methionyl-tRNA formyltransferase